MIDELVLEALFAETAEEIPVPEGRVTAVIDEIERSEREPRRMSIPGPVRRAAPIAAAVLVVVGLGVALSHAGGSGSSAKSATSSAPSVQHGPFVGAPAGVSNGGASKSIAGETVRGRADRSGTGAGFGTAPTTPASGSTSTDGTPTNPTDGAKIVKTGTLDLEVKHDTLRTAVNRVTAIAGGLDGYIAHSTTNFDVAQPTGEITLRVPVDNFEAAVKQLKALPDVKVLGDSETGKDVTAQYTDLQAQLSAAQTEESSLEGVLAAATSVGDILQVRDRIEQVQAEVNSLQGQINLLGDKSDFSAITVTLAEKVVATPAAHVSAPPTGLSKAWKDARTGFSNSLEWMLARSGGALIVVLALLLLAFALRYLYPVVRRALL